jgi:NosR/NirI family nitrous oxide reductase transcriptional regulator
MTRILSVLITLAAFATVAGQPAEAQQRRIYTNPDPASELKRLFPAAASFSPLGGAPLHFKAFAEGRPLGYAFWTTDMVPQEHGYHGPLHILVGLDLTGTITGIIVDYHSEPYGYFSVELPEFPAQFKNKSVFDPFRVGGDVDAVSRASLTINSATRAIRDGSRMMAKAFLDPAAVKRPGAK